jgi:hypothetical protein
MPLVSSRSKKQNPTHWKNVRRKNDNLHEADGNLENNAVAFNEMEATVETETVKKQLVTLMKTL